MHVQVQRIAEALDQGHRTAVSLSASKSGPAPLGRPPWDTASGARTEGCYTFYVREMESNMAATKRVSSGPVSRRGKVRKEFWLDPKALRRAQSILRTSTERETVERALDLVAFGAEVQAGTAALAGLELDRRA